MQLDCETITEFLDRHAADISRGGIFLRTREPHPVGCSVNLQLRLGNGVTMLAGAGTVFWTRASDPSRDESEAGMGIRFGSMTKQSQEILSFLLAEKERRERADDGASEFDNVRTVVASIEAQWHIDAEEAAAEFDRVRTVVARAAQPPVEIAPSLPETPAPQQEPLVLAGPSLPETPAPQQEPLVPAALIATGRLASVPSRPKTSLGIVLAIGAVVTIAACFALKSRPAPDSTSGRSTLAATASALVVSAHDTAPSEDSVRLASPATTPSSP